MIDHDSIVSHAEAIKAASLRLSGGDIRQAIVLITHDSDVADILVQSEGSEEIALCHAAYDRAKNELGG